MFKLILEKPTILLVAILIVCLFGISAVNQAPIQMIPDLDARVITVDTRWPGANPNDVEKEIIIEQEEFLQNINGLDRMLSFAEFGRGIIELEFPFGTDINEALIRVNNALSQVPGYPENVDEPSISAESYSDNAFMFYGFKAMPGYEDEIDVFAMHDWLRENVTSRLERVPGVSSVGMNGGVRRQVKILIDPAELAARQLSLIDVRNAIRSRNIDVSGGDMDYGKRRYLLRTIGRFETLQDLENLIIAERDGAFIRLSDVGTTNMGTEEARSIGYVDTVPTLLLMVRKEPGSNVVAIRDAFNAEVAAINEQLLQQRNTRLILQNEDVRYVVDSTQNVIQNLILGGILAALTLMLFLRSFSGTMIGAIGIPICTLAAFLGIYATDRTINVISLAGVAFAIGMTLDNSIVVLENITRHLSMGKKRFDAALEGVQEVWPAVLASTLTTVMVFTPIIFLNVEAGQLYSDIGVAIAASILMSMLVAIALVPAASSRFLPENYSDNKGFLRSNQLIARINDLGAQIGLKIIDLCGYILASLKRRILVMGTILAATLSVFMFFMPPAEYLPEGEEAKVWSFMFAPPGYNLEILHDLWEEIDPAFTDHVNADRGPYDRGEVDMPPLREVLAMINPGSLMFLNETQDRGDIDKYLEQARKITSQAPGVRTFSSRGSIFSSTRGGTRSINVELSGPEITQLFGTASNVFRRANQTIQDVDINSSPNPSTLSMSQPIARILPNWERAAELGISQQDLGYTLWAWSDGAFVDEFFLDDDKIDMYLYSSEGTVEKPSDIENLTFITRDGSMVPLSALAHIEETVGTSEIPRINGARTVTLNIIPPRSMALETGAQVVREEVLRPMIENGEIPPEIHINITGASGALDATREALSGNLVLAVLIAYLLIVAVFSHWGYPLLIMITVPIGISGGIVGLNLFNLIGGNLGLIGLSSLQAPFDVITMLGFLILIGTVVNNPILIVDRSVKNFEKGMNYIDAVMESVKVRMRPIMMSTITTIFGLSPLVFLPGEGSELYRGVGLIVLSGLLISSLVTLLVLPALVATVLQINTHFKQSNATISEPLS